MQMAGSFHGLPQFAEVDAPGDGQHGKVYDADGKAEGAQGADGQPSAFLHGK